MVCNGNDAIAFLETGIVRRKIRKHRVNHARDPLGKEHKKLLLVVLIRTFLLSFHAVVLVLIRQETVSQIFAHRQSHCVFATKNDYIALAFDDKRLDDVAAQLRFYTVDGQDLIFLLKSFVQHDLREVQSLRSVP